MELLKDIDSLTIRVKKEYAGIPSSWTIKPEFCLCDSSDEEVFYGVSEKGIALGFDFLKTSKTYTLYVVNRKGEEVLYFKKKFSFLSNKVSVFSADEELLGEIQKNSKSVKTVFEIHDASGQPLYQVEGPAISPEVFHIRQDDTIVGKLSKKWAKTVEEGVSPQAHFGIVFPMGCDGNRKGALLGVLLLLDFLY